MALRLVHGFVRQSAGKNSILIAGREHFFDTIEELEEALGLRKDYELVRLDEFTDEEAKEYLRSVGESENIPDWFPKRPLLLASLAARGLIPALLSTNELQDPASAWDRLIDLICDREAQIHHYLDASSIRNILESLSSKARETGSNLGPISEDDVAESFREQVGAYPDEQARPLLQRLPGLSGRNQEDGTRSFLDDQLLDVLRARDLYKFIVDPWSDPDASRWMHGIGPLGSQVTAGLLDQDTIPAAKSHVAVREAIDRWRSPTLALDVLIVLQHQESSQDEIGLDGIVVSEAYCELLDLEELPMITNIALQSCVINKLILPSSGQQGIRIEGSIIQNVYGASSASALPEWVVDCDVENYDTLKTNSEILDPVCQDRCRLPYL